MSMGYLPDEAVSSEHSDFASDLSRYATFFRLIQELICKEDGLDVTVSKPIDGVLTSGYCLQERGILRGERIEGSHSLSFALCRLTQGISHFPKRGFILYRGQSLGIALV